MSAEVSINRWGHNRYFTTSILCNDNRAVTGPEDMVPRRLSALIESFPRSCSFPAGFLLSETHSTELPESTCLLLLAEGGTCWRDFLPRASLARAPMRAGAASLKMGLGCAWPAAYLAFFAWLNLVLVLHFCRILVLALDSVLHFKSVASEISLWHWDHPGPGFIFQQLWARCRFCALAPAARAVTDSLIIYLDSEVIDLGFIAC